VRLRTTEFLPESSRYSKKAVKSRCFPPFMALALARCNPIGSYQYLPKRIPKTGPEAKLKVCSVAGCRNGKDQQEDEAASDRI
jgi:hypothetical protein